MLKGDLYLLALRRAAAIPIAGGGDWFELVGKLDEDVRIKLADNASFQLLSLSFGRQGSNLSRLASDPPDYVVFEFLVNKGERPNDETRITFDAAPLLADLENR